MTFVTHINDDGSKLFVFSLQSPQANSAGTHAHGGMRHGGHGGSNNGSTNNDDQSAPANSMQQ
ncbi:MAG: hypothetical protein KGJ08_00870 [Gammaproteobacteria bacterium]|nr:hypothetical protein [Gammaproteobacteria bacterium]